MAIGKKQEYKIEEPKTTRDLVKEIEKRGAEVIHSTGNVSIIVGGNTLEYNGNFDVILVRK